MRSKNYPIIPQDLPSSEAMRALDDTCRAIFYELALAADGTGCYLLNGTSLITLCGYGGRSPETVLYAILSCARVGLIYICEEQVQVAKKKPVHLSWFVIARWYEEFRAVPMTKRPRYNPYKWRPTHTEATEVRVDCLDDWFRNWGEINKIRPVVVELSLDPKAKLIRTQEALRKSGLKPHARITSETQGLLPLGGAETPAASSRGGSPPSDPPFPNQSGQSNQLGVAPVGDTNLRSAQAAQPPLPPPDVAKGTDGAESRQAESGVSPTLAADGVPEWALQEPPEETDPRFTYAARVVARTVVSPRKGRTVRIFEQREIVAFFGKEFRAAYGRDFHYEQRYEHGVMAALIERSRGDLREVKERIVNAFRCDWMRQQGVTLAMICRHWNRLVIAPSTLAPSPTNTDKSLKTLMEIVQDERQ